MEKKYNKKKLKSCWWKKDKITIMIMLQPKQKGDHSHDYYI